MTKQGFTLIELIIVMAILGLLSVLGLNNFRISQMKSRDVQRKSNLSEIQKALEFYYNDTKLYPANLSALSPATGNIYIKAVPTDPMFGSYDYDQVNGGKAYKIYAKLENTNDKEYYEYTGSTCGTTVCSYVVSSPNLNAKGCQQTGVACTDNNQCCSTSCNTTTHVCD